MGGCAARTASLSSPDPAEKIPAIKQSGETRQGDAVAQLIKDLESDDPAVRMYAASALERITGRTLGYRYYEGEAKRAAAVARWQAWQNGITIAGGEIEP